MRHSLPRQLGIVPPNDWPSVEEQEAYREMITGGQRSLLDEGRSDGQGESYAERNT